MKRKTKPTDFCKIFSKIEILKMFLKIPDANYNFQYIAEISKVSRKDIKPYLDYLIKHKIINKYPSIKRYVYSLNRRKKISRVLLELYQLTLE